MSANWERVAALFRAAHERPESEREAWLREECGEDRELYAELVSLLAAAPRAEAELAAPDPEALADLLGLVELGDGAEVGRYRVLHRLAAGGMGVVFEAECQQPRRRVALKVMRWGLVSERALRRFQLESEFLARLRHPCIATIFESGVHRIEGRDVPWFAMELVEDARPIDRYCDEEELPVEERLDLFEEVCEAIHHGHLRGVIHRDLKPDNILVGASGRPRVIDFGVARATEADLSLTTMGTEAGSFVGTLATMSPEQLAGDPDGVDLRTDVYSLGVVLYRMLAGAMPYDLEGASLPEAVRIIQEEPPVRPSTKNPRLRGDLETILLEALAKEPSRRCASADALREDLQRYRRGEPIRARPPSLSYQLRLMTRRHRAAAIAAGVATLALVIAVVVSTRFAIQARRAASDSDRRLGIVRDVGRDLLYEVLDRMEGVERGTRARAALASSALDYLGALEDEAGGEPALLVDLANGYRRLGSFQADPEAPSLGSVGDAIESYRHALALYERIGSEGAPDAPADRRPLEVRLALARLQLWTGETETAHSQLEEVLRGAEALGERDLSADARIAMASLAKEAGDAEQARALLGEARSDAEALGDAGVDRLARIERDLTALDLRSQDFEGAEAHLAQAEELESDAGPARLRQIDEVFERANLEERRGKVPAANELATEAVSLAREAVDAEPDDAVARERLASALHLFAITESQLGHREAQLEAFGESAELYEDLQRLDPTNLETRTHAVDLRFKEAASLLELDRVEEALAVIEEAVRAMDELLAEDPGGVDRGATVCFGLDMYATILLRAGEAAEALPVLDRLEEFATQRAEWLPDDATAGRQLLTMYDARAVANVGLASDPDTPAAQRIVFYQRAEEAFESCLETFERLKERGFLRPGDDRAAEHMRGGLEDCRRERALLEGAE